MTTCGHCGQTLRKAFGQWLHERESDTLAALLFCPDGHKAEPVVSPTETGD